MTYRMLVGWNPGFLEIKPKGAFMRRCVLLGCTAAVLLLAPTAMADQLLSLDSYSPLNNDVAGPVSTTEALKPNAYYLVTIVGTFSIWSSGNWKTLGVCGGKPEPAPMFPSAGTSDTGPVGLDADTVFAAPNESHFCGAPFPQHQSNLQINTGSGFAYVAPIGGPYSSPTPWHVYFYLLRGTGTAAGFSFRLLDYPTSDNYGTLEILVHRLGRPDCMQNGWTRFGMFKSQGDCASSVANYDGSPPDGWA